MEPALKTLGDCAICKDVPLLPCKTVCCSQLCCKNCYVLAHNNSTKCMFCASAKFQPKPLAINPKQLKRQCRNPKCEQVLTFEEYDKHVYSECDQMRVACRFCKKGLIKKQYLDHCLAEHPNDLLTFAIQELPSAISAHKNLQMYYNEPNAIDFQEQYTNERGKQCKRGRNGKLYCGGSMGSPICQCGSSCGQSLKCNCVACMKLDLRVRGIHSLGYLVNGNSMLCKVEDSVVFCGIRKERNTDNYCNKQSQCGECRRLIEHNFLKRYSTLLHGTELNSK